MTWSRGQERPSPRRAFARAWVAVLLLDICFEGLGRKFVPILPAEVFYFSKDVLLIGGVLVFGVSRSRLVIARRYYGPFELALAAAVAWTVLEVFNPEQTSLLLALVGLRSYWLWWIAPFVVSSALEGEDARARALVLLGAIAVVVAGFAAIQFAFPANHFLNTYALYEGNEQLAVAGVLSTQRARVSSTFSYISGFTDFVVLGLAILLPFAFHGESARTRQLALLGSAACAVAAPMSGSRWPIVVGAGIVFVVIVSSGILLDRRARRAVLALGVALFGAATLVPDALEGVRSRFEYSDTRQRFEMALELVPLVAMDAYEYPPLGAGTGTQQNARKALGSDVRWAAEPETGRYLIELGIPGYLFVWVARIGLVIALVRASRDLSRARRHQAAGAGAALAAVTMLGNLTFDHVFQSLYFFGVGLVLSFLAEDMQNAPPPTTTPDRRP